MLSTATSSSLTRYGFITDNLGGVYIQWDTFINGISETRYQRVNGEGSYLWGEDGLVLDPDGPILSDNLGNLYIISTPDISPWDTDINIHKFNTDGVAQWNGNGTQIIQKPGSQQFNSFILDSDNDLVMTWTDLNTTDEQQSPENPNELGKSDIYAQRIDLNGNVLWPVGGIVVSNAPSAQVGAVIDQLESNSFLIAWTDIRNGVSSDDIYAQRVNLDGTLGDSQPPPLPPEPCVLTHFPAPIRQDQGAWSTISYGGTYKTLNGQSTFVPFKYNERTHGGTDTIADWGCTLTSHAMNINYYADLQDVTKSDGTDFQTDPQILNDWLQRNNGYSTGRVLYDTQQNPYVISSLVDSGAVERYARQSNITLSYSSRVSYNSSTQTDSQFTQTQSNIVNTAMCNLQPGILKVQFPGTTTPGHFVAVSGIATVSGTPSWRIHDPLESDPLSLHQKYSNTFYQYQLARTQVPSEYLSIALHSPAELVITAPDGKKTGFDPISQTTYSEIPEAEYGLDTLSTPDGTATQEQKLFTVHNPLPGSYEIQIIGTGAGEYSLETTFSNDDEIQKLPVISAQTKPNIEDDYILDFKRMGEVPVISRTISFDIAPLPQNTRLFNKLLKTGIVIYGTPTFDPRTLVVSSITLGRGKALPSPSKAIYLDLNRDKLTDAGMLFNLKATGITTSDTEVCLIAQDTNGNVFEGCDVIPWLR